MKRLDVVAQEGAKIGLETHTAPSLSNKEVGQTFRCTNRLRWVVDSINERYLQQAWISETGEIEWQDIETVGWKTINLSDERSQSPGLPINSGVSISNP